VRDGYCLVITAATLARNESRALGISALRLVRIATSIDGFDHSLEFWGYTMFANDRPSTSPPMTFSVVGSSAPMQQLLPGHPPVSAPEGAGVTQIWATNKRSINLRRCDDEPALEYGCVDWFLYDKERPQ
jgi:hypothetical protein